MKLNILIAALSLTACKQPGSAGPGVPPPITDGKCVADIYIGATAMKQTCIYVGYSWACQYDMTVHTCTRGGEASGERTGTVTK